MKPALVLLLALLLLGCATENQRVAYFELALPLESVEWPAPFDSPAPSPKGDVLVMMLHGSGSEECVFSVDVVTPQETIAIWKEARIDKGINPFQEYKQEELFDASRGALIRLDAGEYEIRAVVNGEEHTLTIKVIAGEVQMFIVYYSVLGTMLADHKDIEEIQAMFR